MQWVFHLACWSLEEAVLQADVGVKENAHSVQASLQIFGSMFTSSLHFLTGIRLSRSCFCRETPCSFIWTVIVVSALPTWIWDPFLYFRFASQWSQLKLGFLESGFFVFFLYHPFSSLLSWLGDFFFLLSGALIQVFVVKLKTSFPMERSKLNLELVSTSPWKNARHFSNTKRSIFRYQGHIKRWLASRSEHLSVLVWEKPVDSIRAQLQLALSTRRVGVKGVQRFRWCMMQGVYRLRECRGCSGYRGYRGCRRC